MSPSREEWKNAYETLPGEMKGCLGSACPNSCCGEKDFGKASGEGHGIMYRTSLMKGELEHLESTGPSFEELGVEVVTFQHELRNQTSTLINNCLGEDGCKLEPHGKKPMQCRIYPFGFNYMNGPFTECPEVAQILAANGRPLLDKIDSADVHLGFTRIATEQLRLARRRK